MLESLKREGAIVLIDDSKQEMLLCKEAIKDANVENPLVTFYEPHAALDYIHRHIKNIFIIICDINMPLMTGMELLEKINANKELKLSAIPFIFLTNSDVPEDVVDAYMLTAQGYFQKPMHIYELTAIFKDIIGYWKKARIPPKQR